MSDEGIILMGRYIGPQMKVMRSIKPLPAPAVGKSYQVVSESLGNVHLKLTESTGRWVNRSEVQMFWLLPDGTELEALE